MAGTVLLLLCGGPAVLVVLAAGSGAATRGGTTVAVRCGGGRRSKKPGRWAAWKSDEVMDSLAHTHGAGAGPRAPPWPFGNVAARTSRPHSSSSDSDALVWGALRRLRSEMGAAQSAALESLAGEVNMSKDEIQRMYIRFKKLDKNNSGGIDVNEFMQIANIANNPLAQRVISIFDDDGGGEVEFSEFVRVRRRQRWRAHGCPPSAFLPLTGARWGRARAARAGVTATAAGAVGVQLAWSERGKAALRLQSVRRGP